MLNLSSIFDLKEIRGLDSSIQPAPGTQVSSDVKFPLLSIAASIYLTDIFVIHQQFDYELGHNDVEPSSGLY